MDHSGEVPATGAAAARWGTVLLALAVVLAFADASVVVLALPDLYGEYDATVVGVSWVITSYALVVAVSGLLLAVVRRGRAVPLTLLGLGLFAAASAGCALAPTLASLIAGRCLQGLGGAALLVGSRELLETRHPGLGSRVWAVAGTAGLAIGPALGGALTEWFDWRAIFAVQAPAAALGLLVGVGPRPTPVAPAIPVSPAGGVGLAASAGVVATSAALVGALFLGVLLVIEVWGFSPAGGAVVVSALPAAALAVAPLHGRAQPRPRGAIGSLLLASGLAALALLPAASPWWAAGALALCGAGFGLLSGIVDTVPAGAVAGTPSARRTAAMTVGLRHAGLVLGLVVVAPLLAADLDRAAGRAAVTGAATVLDARLDVSDKIRVALALRDEVERTPRGEVPDLERPFAEVDEERARLGADLRRDIQAVLTRGFRDSFLVAAALALMAGAAVLAAARPARPAPTGFRARGGVAALSLLVLAGGGLVGAELAAGGAGFGATPARDPCRTGPDPYPGDGFDAAVQRLLLGGLDGAACELGTTREELVLSLDGDAGLGTLHWDRPTVQRAVRSGLVRAVDDSERRGTVPGWAAGPLREAVARAPVEALLGAADWMGDALRMLERGIGGIRDFFGR